MKSIQLKSIHSYTQEQIAEVSNFSSAFKNYIQQLQNYTELKSENKSIEVRLRRNNNWCECVLASFFKTSSTEEVCLYWSQFADDLLKELWPFQNSDFGLFALGKLGAEELNLSSDIDLIIVRNDGAEFDLKKLSEFQKILSEYTDFGFCFRLDFNLRPGGKSSPLITSLGELEYHYGYHGEMWERMAWVRSRAICGEPILIQKVQDFMSRFSYRKHIDLTLHDDLSLLRYQINQDLERKPLKNTEFNLKLSKGAIRDIELFVHSMQIMHGGKKTLLKTHSTTKALNKLSTENLLNKADSEFLLKSYWKYRSIENLLHASLDLQNYLLNERDEFKLQFNFKELIQTSYKCDQIISSYLHINDSDILPKQLPAHLQDQQIFLKELGFSSESIFEVWPQIIESTALSKKSQTDELARLQFLENTLKQISSFDSQKDQALILLLDFVKASRAKASLFSLLNREQNLRHQLISLFLQSPYLSQIISQRPELIDSLFYGMQSEEPEDLEDFLDYLIERRMLVEILCAQSFINDPSLDKLTHELSRSADNIVLSLMRKLNIDDLQILALGKWGANENAFHSDLDFIFVTEKTPQILDQKLAKKIMNLLTQTHRAGQIYSIDMRLRPSGSAGPLIVSKNSLIEFLKSDAPVWQRQSYLRARSLSLDNEFTHKIRSTILSKKISPEEWNELKSIRSQLLEPHQSSLDIKYAPGGLIDIEFYAQIMLLKNSNLFLDQPIHTSTKQILLSLENILKLDLQTLVLNYDFLRKIEQFNKLFSQHANTKIDLKSESYSSICRVLKFDPSDLYEQIQQAFQQNTEITKNLFSF